MLSQADSTLVRTHLSDDVVLTKIPESLMIGKDVMKNTMIKWLSGCILVIGFARAFRPEKRDRQD